MSNMVIGPTWWTVIQHGEGSDIVDGLSWWTVQHGGHPAWWTVQPDLEFVIFPTKPSQSRVPQTAFTINAVILELIYLNLAFEL